MGFLNKEGNRVDSPKQSWLTTIPLAGEFGQADTRAEGKGEGRQVSRLNQKYLIGQGLSRHAGPLRSFDLCP
jgi:hypothetical protein